GGGAGKAAGAGVVGGRGGGGWGGGSGGRPASVAGRLGRGRSGGGFGMGCRGVGPKVGRRRRCWRARGGWGWGAVAAADRRLFRAGWGGAGPGGGSGWAVGVSARKSAGIDTEKTPREPWKPTALSGLLIPTRSFGPRPELPSGWPSQPFGCWILVAEDPDPVPHHCRSSDASVRPEGRSVGPSPSRPRAIRKPVRGFPLVSGAVGFAPAALAKK